MPIPTVMNETLMPFMAYLSQCVDKKGPTNSLHVAGIGQVRVPKCPIMRAKLADGIPDMFKGKI